MLRKRVLIFLLSVFCLLPPLRGDERELIEFGTAWRFTDADPGKGWMLPDYDDSTWQEGLGAPVSSTRRKGEATTESAEEEKPAPPARYFRRRFTVEDAQSVSALLIETRYSGGVAIYLNGKKIISRNLPDHPRYGTFALEPQYPPQMSIMRGGIAQEVFTGLSPELLRDGENLIAAEVHRLETGHRVLFDLRLVAHSGFDIIAGPFLTLAHGTRPVLIFETNVPSIGRVKYGSGSASRTAAFNPPSTIHRVELKGVGRGQKCFYQVEAEVPKSWCRPLKPIRSERYNFSIPPDSAKGLKFVVYGDSRTQTDIHSAIVKGILKQKPQLVINTGDVITRGSYYSLWREQFFNPIAQLASSVPYVLAPGNHEDNHWNLYYYIFGLNSVTWYSFDVGDAHFLILDTNVPFNPGSDQYKFADRDLSESKAKWKFVFFHHPPLTCVPHRIRTKPNSIMTNLVPLFEKHRVDIVFNGHDHHYVRWKPMGGVTYITTGGGGAPLYPIKPQESSEVAVSAHHFCVVELNDAGLRMKVIDVEGNVIDTLSLKKRR